MRLISNTLHHTVFNFFIRMWDLENEENYILTLDGHSGYDQNETITCIHFCEKKGGCQDLVLQLNFVGDKNWVTKVLTVEEFQIR